jgi:hypothetical protein
MKAQIIEQISNEFESNKQFIQTSFPSLFSQSDVVKLLEEYTNKIYSMIQEVPEQTATSGEYEEYVPLSVVEKVLSKMEYVDYCEADTSSAEFDLQGNEIYLDSCDVEFRERNFKDDFLSEVQYELEALETMKENDLAPQHN